MEKSLQEALKQRRSYYRLSNQSTLSDNQLEELLSFILLHTPSAFNSQSTRMVLLLKEEHQKLWKIVLNTLKPALTQETFAKTTQKITHSFASGYGTVLFFEDWNIIEELQNNYPLYQEQFPIWAQHTSAMHQLIVWMMLESKGLGASLQHYNPLIDQEVKQTWNLPQTWKLTAQMPFGIPQDTPAIKTYTPVSERLKIFI
jgi:predicted oxidoreductase (fatty acid repression mutant protein)